MAVSPSIPVELPDNVPACHAVILRQAEVIAELTARIERLNRDLAALRRQLFGSRRERFVSGGGEEQGGEEIAVEPDVFAGTPTADEPFTRPSAATPPRTSKGR